MSTNDSSGKPYDREWDRVYIDPDSHIATAQIIWPTGERTFVLDISYKGAAFRAPSTLKIELKKTMEVAIDLKLSGEVKVTIEPMWNNEDIVGVKFSDLSPPSKLVLGEFLNDKIIGLHLREIESTFYAPGLNCNFWYHGPSDVNFYIWAEDHQQPTISALKSARIELPGGVIQAQRDNLSVSVDEANFDQLNQRRPMWDSKKRRLHPKDFLLLRCSDLLSQIKNRPQCVEDLLILVRRHML